MLSPKTNAPFPESQTSFHPESLGGRLQPSRNDLMVRFLWINGRTNDLSLTARPLANQGIAQKADDAQPVR
jgi:hypothetical protein